MRVGPVAEGYRRHIQPRKAAIGLVHHVDADFFLHHVALVAKIFVVNLERAHAIRFQPQNAFQRVRGNCLEIVSDVVHGRAVQDAATGIDQLDVLHFGRVF